MKSSRRKVENIFELIINTIWGLPWWLSGKESMCNAGDTGDAVSIPVLRRSPRGRNGNPLQYSCLENPMDRGAWQASVYRVAQSRTRLKQLSMHACIHLKKNVYIFEKENKPAELVSRCCCNKLSQNLWFKITQLFYLKFQIIWSPKWVSVA